MKLLDLDLAACCYGSSAYHNIPPLPCKLAHTCSYADRVNLQLFFVFWEEMANIHTLRR